MRADYHGARYNARMPMLNSGDSAPDFAAPAHNGETVKLADFAGKYVVLWFYPKARTPG